MIGVLISGGSWGGTGGPRSAPIVSRSASVGGAMSAAERSPPPGMVESSVPQALRSTDVSDDSTPRGDAQGCRGRHDDGCDAKTQRRRGAEAERGSRRLTACPASAWHPASAHWQLYGSERLIERRVVGRRGCHVRTSRREVETIMLLKTSIWENAFGWKVVVHRPRRDAVRWWEFASPTAAGEQVLRQKVGSTQRTEKPVPIQLASTKGDRAKT